MVPPAVQTRVALQIAYHDDSKIDPTGSRDLRRAAQDRGRKARHHPERAADRARRLDALPERYKTIALPTLILWCDHDRIVPLEVG